MSRKLLPVFVPAPCLVHINSAFARKEEPLRAAVDAGATAHKSSAVASAAPDRQGCSLIKSWSFDKGGVAGSLSESPRMVLLK